MALPFKISRCTTGSRPGLRVSALLIDAYFVMEMAAFEADGCLKNYCSFGGGNFLNRPGRKTSSYVIAYRHGMPKPIY